MDGGMFRPVDENLSLSATRRVEHPALKSGDETVSYRSLNRLVDSIAAFLQRNLGLTPGERVLLLLSNGLEFVTAYYAVMRAGGVVVPVNPRSVPREISHYLDDSEPHLAVARLDSLAHVPLESLRKLRGGILVDQSVAAGGPGDLRRQWANWTHATQDGGTPAPVNRDGSAMALIAYTSGTTGVPKGCVHTHGGIQSAISSVRAAVGTAAADVVLVTLPLYHVTGMQTSMNVPLDAGATLVLAEKWNAAAAAQLIETHRVTRWRSIATMIRDFVELPNIGAFDLSSLNAIGGGGAAVPLGLHARIREITSLDYQEGFGMTEAMGATHMNRAGAPRPGSIGRLVEGVDAFVISTETDLPLPVGEEGELVVAGAQLFSGYFGREDETNRSHLQIDGRRYFRTGDIGHVDEDGYYFITDRRKRMINVSGLKVWPAEVEQVIMLHPDVAEACVVAAEDLRQGEMVRAIIVLKAAVSRDGTAEELTCWCRENLSAYKIPRLIEFRDALPRTATGKTAWKALQQQVSAEPPASR
ncbi:MAG: long-chain fatty acid--CoA ligase [Mesorhizobium sp.]|uniref:AMP-binding protein n=1 Tax=Mesorhizobium sp. TaxID=1871066 RepID=UPI000FE61C21|nr:AMP-binding protein [Mesorhizobium sp.]RWD67056.1 MAG: long-chain fatty acid--CoA ligase [Mesorhizobium sp.]RWE33564.1 MAG: long-chain fatty acid--CoA ligase [Mesorhizobium sp.]